MHARVRKGRGVPEDTDCGGVVVEVRWMPRAREGRGGREGREGAEEDGAEKVEEGE